MHHHRYMDQPAHNLGLVSTNDTLYPELSAEMKRVSTGAAAAHAAGMQQCALDTGSWHAGRFRGALTHPSSSASTCLVPSASGGTVVMGECYTADGLHRANTAWIELPNGRLRHNLTRTCLDVGQRSFEAPLPSMLPQCTADGTTALRLA